MILLENKLEMFNKIVYKTKERECELKLDEVKKQCEEEIKKKKVELEKNSDEIIKRRTSLAKKRKYEILGKVAEDKRIAELQKTEELRKKLIEELEKKVLEFTSTDEYIEFEKDKFRTLLEELDDGNYILKLTISDKDKLFNELISLTNERDINFIYEELDSNLLGGFIVSDEQKTYNIDSSLKEKIEDKKYEIGKLLDFSLRKEGEQA